MTPPYRRRCPAPGSRSGPGSGASSPGGTPPPTCGTPSTAQSRCSPTRRPTPASPSPNTAPRAEHVTPPDGGVRTARLADGTELRADAVLLAQGHLDVDPGDPGTVGEGHIPPGYTVDQNFSAIPAGEGVLVRGFSLAFIDLMEILTEGRGGRFERGAGDAVPTYVPSGREPVLWVGSRRGGALPVQAGRRATGRGTAPPGPCDPRRDTADTRRAPGTRSPAATADRRTARSVVGGHRRAAGPAPHRPSARRSRFPGPPRRGARSGGSGADEPRSGDRPAAPAGRPAVQHAGGVLLCAALTARRGAAR